MSEFILDRGRLGILTPTFARGGCEEYVIALARWARSAGWHPTVCLPDVEGVASVRQDLDDDGIATAALTAWLLFTFSEDRFLEARRDALRLIRANHFDRLVLVLPTIEFGGALIDAAAMADAPAAVLYQLVPYRHAFLPFERQIYTWARRQRQTWLTVSYQNRDLLCESLGWAPDAAGVVTNALLRPITEIDEGTRTALRRAIRRELGAPDDALLVLTAARLHVQKAFDVTIDAAAAVCARQPRVHFVWVGTGDLQDELRAEIVQRGLAGRVHLTGYRNDVERFLHASDAFVLPSRFEGLPFAALEAMAAGLPGIFSDIGPHREIVTHGQDGLLVPVGDPEALAEAIERVLTQPEAAAALGAAARRRARDFAPATSFARLFDLLETASTRHPPPRANWPLPDGPRRRVAVFGAGAGGRRAFEESMPDSEVVAFLDSRASSGATLLGRPVLRPEAALHLDLDAVVVASVHAGQMCKTLRDLGYAEDRVELFPPSRLLPIE